MPHPALPSPFPRAPACGDENLLAGLPDDPTLLVWPSQVWNAHAGVCDQPLKQCPHVADLVGGALPGWWWAVMRQRQPIDPDPAKAVERAMVRLNGYKGGPTVTPEAAALARDLTRDALIAATGPLTLEWVKQTLACLGALCTWVHNEGEPLTREHVLDPSTWGRYLDGRHGATMLSAHSRRNYRLRYDKITATLTGSQRTPRRNTKTPLGHNPSMLPLTRQQETDLWVWSQGLRPVTVRQRIQAVLVTSLGVGCRRRDFLALRAVHVTRDERGVHVCMAESTTTGNRRMPARTVTCLAVWENRLWAVAQSMEPGCFLSSPWRTHQPTDPRSVDVTMRTVNNNPAARPPVDFSSESLRNTWLVRHLEAGTPLPVLMPQAALATTTSLDKLLPFTSPVADAAMRMRGGC